MIPLDAKRSPEQNDKLWPMLRDIARQVKHWHTNERGDWVLGLMDEASWKAVLTAAFERDTRMALGLDGGTVMVGASTSKYSQRRFAELIEFIYAAGAERDVQWSEKSKQTYRDHCRPQEAANG